MSFIEIAFFISFQLITLLVWLRLIKYVKSKNEKFVKITKAFMWLNYIITFLIFLGELEDGSYTKMKLFGFEFPDYILFTIIVFFFTFRVVKVLRKALLEKIDSFSR
ncbi:MAG: hypothetical protein C0459_00870 [Chitinophaga sp.]|jgi:hypothetical protein|nr:hypothetical protein [Chitinophaga sp.]